MVVTEVTFCREVAELIGVNEALLLRYLLRTCCSGRLIKKRAMNVKSPQKRMFRRSINSRLNKSGLIDGHRYKRIPVSVLHYHFPWVSVHTIRRCLYDLRKRGLIDVKRPDLLVNDGTNCYSTFPGRIRKFKIYCRKHTINKPRLSHKRLHRRYTFTESKLDPNCKPLRNDSGQIIGAITDFDKPRLIIK